jgi:hypothetical protein
LHGSLSFLLIAASPAPVRGAYISHVMSSSTVHYSPSASEPAPGKIGVVSMAAPIFFPYFTGGRLFGHLSKLHVAPRFFPGTFHGVYAALLKEYAITFPDENRYAYQRPELLIFLLWHCCFLSPSVSMYDVDYGTDVQTPINKWDILCLAWSQNHIYGPDEVPRYKTSTTLYHV